MKTFKDLLIELKACKEFCEWAGDKTIEQVVADCHRGDWLIWLGKKIEIDSRKFTLAKAHCANTVRHLMQDQRSLDAIDTAIKYGEGKASDEDLNEAESYAAAAIADAYAYAAAYSAESYAADAAAYAAAGAAAYAAITADSAYADADAAAAYSADSYAAYAAAYAADADADAAAAKKENQLQTANICRQYIGQLIIQRVNELINN